MVLEKEEEEKLRVVREDEGFNIHRPCNPVPVVFKNAIYAFETQKYDKIHRYNGETGKWSLYYSQ